MELDALLAHLVLWALIVVAEMAAVLFVAEDRLVEMWREIVTREEEG